MELTGNNIKFKSVCKINRSLMECTEIDNLTNINEFLINLIIEQIKKDTNKRRFEINNTSTQVFKFCSDLSSNFSDELIITSEFKTDLANISIRLLNSEVNAQEKLKNFANVEIMKGSLITALIQNEGKSYVVLVKVEHDEFIDDVLYEIRRGIPTKNIKYKSCIFTFQNDELLTIMLFDPNDTDYWYCNFLELRKIGDDTRFSNNAHRVIKESIDYFNTDYPQDCVNLRQIVNSYFITNETFLYSDIIEKIESYECFNERFNTSDIIEKINDKKRSPRNHFENSFKIDRPSIKKKLTQQYKVNKKISLEIMPDDSLTEVPNYSVRTYITSAKEGDKAFVKVFTENKKILKEFNYENVDFSDILNLSDSEEEAAPTLI